MFSEGAAAPSGNSQEFYEGSNGLRQHGRSNGDRRVDFAPPANDRDAHNPTPPQAAGPVESEEPPSSSSSSSTSSSDVAGKLTSPLSPMTPAWVPQLCRPCSTLTVFMGGMLVLVVGIIALTVLPKLITGLIHNMLVIEKPGSLVFNIWRDTAAEDISLTRSYYLFNLTNPYEVYNNHSTPDYSIVGPFVYREHTYSFIDSIFWLANVSLGYHYASDLHFLPELSVDKRTGQKLDPQTTPIVNINYALYAITYRLSKMPNITVDDIIPISKQDICILVDALVADTVVGQTGIFTNHTAHELLFGYVDPILQLMSVGAAAFEYNIPTKFHYVWNHTLPTPSPYDFRYGQKCPIWDDISICNTSIAQVSQVFSGQDYGLPRGEPLRHPGGLEQVAQLTQWAGQSDMWWWGEEGTCRRIEGSNGMLFPNGIGPGTKAFVFLDELYRKLELSYERDSSVEGVDTVRFRVSPTEWALGENAKCYHQELEGIWNLSAPTFAPAFAGSPLFFHAPLDQPVKDVVANRTVPLINFTMDGMPFAQWRQLHAPDPGDFETFVDILPVTGSLMQGAARVQQSTWLAPITIDDCPGIFPQLLPRTIVQNNETVAHSAFPKTMVPTFYLDRFAKVGPSLASRIRDDTVIPYLAAKVGGGLFVAIGGLLMLLSGFQMFLRWKGRKVGAMSPRSLLTARERSAFENRMPRQARRASDSRIVTTTRPRQDSGGKRVPSNAVNVSSVVLRNGPDEASAPKT